MINFEEFENLINDIKSSLDDTTSALLSEKLLNVVSNYKIGVDKIEEMTKDLEKIKNEKDELLKVNGKLFQQIGFDKVEDEELKEDSKNDENDEIDINEIINEKGEII